MKKQLRTALAALLAAFTLLPLTACGAPNTTPPTEGSDEEIVSPLPDGSTENTPDEPTVEQPEETPEQAPAPVEPVVDSYFRCTSENVNLRSGAGTGYAILGQAEKNTTYAIIGKQGNWYKTYYRGKVAYFYAEYAAVFSLESSKNKQVEQVIDEAYKHIGVPYVYGAVRLHDGTGRFLGGFTAQKFDCSSLVQYVFYQAAGKILQTTTRTQVKQGKYVAPSDLQRGDCIFFTNESREHLTGVERVGHVAIYLGNNYILHTASDFARIEKISTQRWNYYIEARRFV
ncbi:MAG: C40 family peptidase [Clostridia bacterium]|nr:C40 family peptidase [Clostridia bacterium]